MSEGPVWDVEVNPVRDAPAADVFELCVFGRGVGECVAIHIGHGQWCLVDSTRNPDTDRPAALSYLEHLDVEPASHVVVVALTHFHRDHYTGFGEAEQEQLRDWRASGHRLATFQDDVSRHEARAKSVRVVQTGVVAGLLQTDEYAWGVLAAFARLTGENESAAAEAVARRIARQRILYDSKKSFEFVLMESALNYWPCSPEAMLVQLSRIRDMANRKNIDVRVVRAEALIEYPAVHGFVLFDDRSVVIDLANTAVFTQGAKDIKMYEELYGSYRAASVPCTEEVLAPYRTRLTERLGRPG